MAQIVNMPRLSDTMEEGVVAKWHKKVGDQVDEGDLLAEIETDKATMDFENPFEAGILLHIGVKEGETVPVDSLLAIIGKKDEDIKALLSGASPAPVQEAKKEEKLESKNQSISIPEGVEIIRMPRLSDTMEEGTVAKWLKKVGDLVKEGDVLAEIETDKATMEFESPYEDGSLLYIGIEEGKSVPVDSVLAILGPKGTDLTGFIKNIDSLDTPEKAVKEKAPEKNIASPTTIAPSQSSDRRVFVSPLARKMAEERGVSLVELKGSGENGRIIKRDIEAYIHSSKEAAKSTSVAQVQALPFIPAGEESAEEIKNSQMRKTIAKRLAESKFTAPHYYLTVELDMEEAMLAREHMNDLPDTKISFNDMVVKACAMALRKHPQVNTTWTADSIRYYKHIHIGVAVAVDEGLVVPVLRFADQMSLSTIGSQVRELAGKARNKKLSPQEMEGSTFTVSNLGMFGIMEFTSIINQPNSAILSVGAIIEKPVVKNGQIVIGHVMKVTLACDHRTVDGATGAQFLQTLRAYIERPVTMLV